MPSKRLALLVLSAVLGSSAPVSADDWLVYHGGGVQPIEGGWDYRSGRVLFHKLGGTLVSVPYADVDLATSAFLTWQLNGRLEAPPRGPVPEEKEPGDGAKETPCVAGRVVDLVDTETLVVRSGREKETVHVACLDAPDTKHRLAELGWFGRTALNSIKFELRAGDEVCLGDASPVLRDERGHRIVYVKLAGGRDYAAGVIAGGLGLLRLGPCSRAGRYRKLEERAIEEERGLWGPRSEQVAFAAVRNAMAIAGGAGTALPPRRVGGG